MAKLRISLLLGAAVAALSTPIVRTYRNDMATAWRHLDAVDKKWVTTPYGTVEYADSGTGEPVLVSHGIFHGCDGGLLSVRDILPGRRVIAPSRFGYLGSTVPAGASPEDQADAFAALLDDLELAQVDVIGISAGTTAALEFALRHPGRVRHLVLQSGNLPGDPTSVAPPAWAKALYNDATMWALKHFARPRLARMMGVPEGFPRNTEEAQAIDEMLDSIFPVRPRAAGAIFDAYISNPAVNDLPIERITVPTMLVHSKDDPLCSFAPVEAAADRIPGCRLVAFETGGHLGLGQSERTRAALDQFLAVPMVA
jgi:pimeloyl-ACP methyl ester carboxylesterase